MPLTTGTRLGPYEIVAAIGAGGMGEVYRARDTKLMRDVAIKVLPDAFAQDADRLARFRHEAQVLASLNHPHIGAIYGIEDSPSTNSGRAGSIQALVLELVEGPTLADRIAQRPIALADALPIATQIAAALEAAHEQGIVHRDLKPANIKIRSDGTVKVLDFGLAKALGTEPARAAVDAMDSPTITARSTEFGVILGTAAYMAPEQARGLPVDKRADIWAFGCVLYEMLTGGRTFHGATVQDVLAAVLRAEIDWQRLPGDTPPSVRRLLRRCLERNPHKRLRDIGEARLVLDDPAASWAGDAASVAAPRGLWRSLLPWGIAVSALAIAGAVVWRTMSPELPAALVYATLDAPADYVFGEDDPLASLPTRTPMVFTPDGRSLIIQAARAGKPQLFLRSLDRPDTRLIAGTDDARVPFVSPDGKFVGFWSTNEIRKVPLEGGAATTVCPMKAILGPYGAAWGAGEVIVFGDEASGRIMRVPAAGGTPAPVTSQPTSGRRHSAPAFFPDGKRILFSDVSTRDDVSDSRLMVQSIDGGDARLVIAAAADGRLLPSGQLVFMRLGTLMTVAFDPARAEVTGDAVVAMSGVMQSGLRARFGAESTVAGMFALSSLGTLGFVRGSLIGPVESPMIWATRDGRFSSAEPANGAPQGARGFARFSPDRSRAIVRVSTPTRVEMWIADWTRDAWTLCPDCHGEWGFGVWSPDGVRLLLGRNNTLVAHALDGSSPDQVLVQEDGRQLVPGGWLADGRIVYQSSPDSKNYEIKLLDKGGHVGRVVVPLGIGSEPEVSPDGRWLAYGSDPTSLGEVVVQAFPGPGSRVQISAGGGSNPAWSRDGRTLYYLRRTEARGSAVIAVDIDASSVLTAGKPRELLRRPDSQRCGPVRCYDISADGLRFLLRDRTAAPRVSVTRMDLVLNWAATLSMSR